MGEVRIRQITARQRGKATAACWSYSGRNQGKEGFTDLVSCYWRPKPVHMGGISVHPCSLPLGKEQTFFFFFF